MRRGADSSEADLRPVADRLSRAFPGRVLAGRPSGALYLSALPGWRQGERALADGTAEIAGEPSLVLKPWRDEDVAGRAFVVRVRVARAIGRARRRDGDGLDRFEADFVAVMERLGLAPRAMDAADGIHLFRTSALERDVLAVASALLSRIEPVTGYHAVTKAGNASRPNDSALPELSRKTRAALLAALGRRERAAR